MPLNTGATGLVSVAHSQNFWGNLDIFFDNGGTATTGVLKVHVFNNSASTSGTDAWGRRLQLLAIHGTFGHKLL